jgi:hypothetical protein
MTALLVHVPLEITIDAIVRWLDGVGRQLIGDAQGLAPHLAYAVIIGVIGFVAAGFVEDVVTSLAQKVGVDDLVEGSLLGDSLLADVESPSALLGYIAAIYVYLLTALLIASELALGRVAAALNGVVGFLPTAIVAIVVVGVGFWLADVVEERVSAAAPDDGGRVGELFGLALQVFVYLIAVAVGFGVFAGTSGGAGFAIPIVQAFALGFALAFGLAIGWGAKEYLDADALGSSDDDTESKDTDTESSEDDTESSDTDAESNDDDAEASD